MSNGKIRRESRNDRGGVCRWVGVKLDKEVSLVVGMELEVGVEVGMELEVSMAFNFDNFNSLLPKIV